jgi:hypothetical protein
MSTSKTTLRYYINDKRVSTAVITRKGEFWQVWPTKKQYYSEALWREDWTPRYTVKTTISDVPKKVPSMKAEDWTFENKHVFTAPAGTYYIGDLCYALDDKVYDSIFGNVGGYDDGVYKCKTDPSVFFMVAGTAYGDGEYRGNDDRSFFVDAGIIGILPLSCATRGTEGGNVYTFKKPVECRMKGGKYTFSSEDNYLFINTAGSSKED